MPPGALFRIPASLSKGGTCKTNLRGVNASAPLDYINPSRNITSAFIQARPTSEIGGVGNWANTITTAYEASSTSSAVAITYPSLLSSSRTGTFFFRMYVKSTLDTTPSIQYVCQNGNITGGGSGSGWAIYLNTDIKGAKKIFFIALSSTIENLQLCQSQLTEDTWYSYTVQFTYDPLATPSFTVSSWENGVQINNSATMTTMNVPSGGTTFFNAPGVGNLLFYGGITDVAFLETNTLTKSFIESYANSPFT